ncbi:MAG: nucleotidyl transferase AbiEii/AbiGii toxin family protein [Candidatus Taylorbacteria bacterium]|nr:nucleotidyl transferase AbiEii/AbiGii toxin family protein [Candidatus Taylorbacteria bacterium]
MHDEVLTKEASGILSSFGQFESFYLVGGTALALQIGHRISVDFDFFISTPLPDGLLRKIKRVFENKQISVTYSAPEQLNLIIEGVKVTFFSYPYQNIYPFIPYKKINLASIAEIALMKAFSIGKRFSYKDYVDWYFLLKGKYVSLEAVIEGALKKFGADFNDRLFLGQLVSMEDVPVQKIDFLKEEISRENVMQFLESEVTDFRNQL